MLYLDLFRYISQKFKVYKIEFIGTIFMHLISTQEIYPQVNKTRALFEV